MDRRAFLALAGSGALAGCGTFFGPPPAADEAEKDDGEVPDPTGYDEDRDPGYDGDPLRVLVLEVPDRIPVEKKVPVRALVRNDSETTVEANVVLTLRSLASGERMDSLDYTGEVSPGADISIDVLLAAPSEPGEYRVTVGDPDSPAAAADVTVTSE